jgi:hypothetical protein
VTSRLIHRAADRLKVLTPLALRRWVVRTRLAARILTGRYRTMPDALVIGAQRCGTSSLYKHLGRHPNAAPSLRKEVDYFTIDHAKGERWYRAHFPLELRRRLARRRGRPFVTFEATPDYLFDPRAPERVKRQLPDVKLIVLLRDPVSRAVSHYHHNVRHGLEPLDIAGALEAEDDRLDGAYEEVLDDPDSRALDLRRYSYVGRGRYAEQLARWRALFPPEQMLVVRSADLFDPARDGFGHILDFLGLPRWQPEEFRNYSYRNPFDGEYPDPPAEVTAFLRTRFAQADRDLVDLLGDGFRWDAPVPT